MGWGAVRTQFDMWRDCLTNLTVDAGRCFGGGGRVTVEYTKPKWKLKWKPSVAGYILITGRHTISSLSFDRERGWG